MSSQIKFMKHYVTDGKVKARVFYSNGVLTDGRECVTLYARGYDRALGKIQGLSYENDTDYQTDYFDEGCVRIFPSDPLYAAALERVNINASKAKAVRS